MTATAAPAAERHEPQMLSDRSVAQILETTPLVVRRLARDGKFPKPVRLNHKLSRWPRRVVMDWLARQSAPTAHRR